MPSPRGYIFRANYGAFPSQRLYEIQAIDLSEANNMAKKIIPIRPLDTIEYLGTVVEPG